MTNEAEIAARRKSIAVALAATLCLIAIALGSPIGLMRIPYLVAGLWLFRSMRVPDPRAATMAWVTASIGAVIALALATHAAILLGTGAGDDETVAAFGLDLVMLGVNGLIVFFAVYGSIEGRAPASEKSVL